MRPAQKVGQGVHLRLVMAVEVGIGTVGAVAVAQLQLNFVEPGRIDQYRYIELIVALIAAGIVALTVALLILVIDLGFVFVNIGVDTRDL